MVFYTSLPVMAEEVATRKKMPKTGRISSATYYALM
jgi:hypothetical protein